MTPLTHPAKKIDQSDSEIKDVLGLVLHVQEEVYQSSYLKHPSSVLMPNSNLIKDKILVLGLDIVERQV